MVGALTVEGHRPLLSCCCSRAAVLSCCFSARDLLNRPCMQGVLTLSRLPKTMADPQTSTARGCGGADACLPSVSLHAQPFHLCPCMRSCGVQHSVAITAAFSCCSGCIQLLSCYGSLFVPIVLAVVVCVARTPPAATTLDCRALEVCAAGFLAVAVACESVALRAAAACWCSPVQWGPLSAACLHAHMYVCTVCRWLAGLMCPAAADGVAAGWQHTCHMPDLPCRGTKGVQQLFGHTRVLWSWWRVGNSTGCRYSAAFCC